MCYSKESNNINKGRNQNKCSLQTWTGFAGSQREVSAMLKQKPEGHILTHDVLSQPLIQLYLNNGGNRSVAAELQTQQAKTQSSTFV